MNAGRNHAERQKRQSTGAPFGVLLCTLFEPVLGTTLGYRQEKAPPERELDSGGASLLVETGGNRTPRPKEIRRGSTTSLAGL